MQLSKPRDQGGLKLQLMALKSTSLLINRHLREIESIPFYNSFLAQANPPHPPADLLCLKKILQARLSLPPPVLQNPSSDQIHRFYIDQTDQPRVEQRYPTVNWKRVWLNIASKELDSCQRSTYYLLVNEKIEHRKLWHTIRRVDSENCAHCNAGSETLKHKFSECQRVAAAWELLNNTLAARLNNRRRFSFEELLHPELNNMNKRQKTIVMKHFINYVTFINRCDNIVNVRELEFYLLVEL